MKIVIDDKIPYICGVFERFADIFYLGGADISTKDLCDADALIIRTRTRCTQELLERTKVGVIATATIGFDHIDLDYCQGRSIEVHRAAGCNARAVGQWVFAALKEMGKDRGVIGIIGVGNVGSEVQNMARERGYTTLLCDPPRAQREGREGFVELEELLQKADIITIHTPLEESTRGMVNKEFLAQTKEGVILLNSSRGEVVVEEELIKAIESGKIQKCALDVWANEPNINQKLLPLTKIATPHIAGYSARGKARGTEMVVRAIAKNLGIKELKTWEVEQKFEMEDPDHYNIIADDKSLRSTPLSFEKLRGEYRYR
ncbi:MAG: 4-phosphoerythronate dehydrogenase [Rikenellaceae bacterium]